MTKSAQNYFPTFVKNFNQINVIVHVYNYFEYSVITKKKEN